MMRLEKTTIGDVALLKITGSISFSDISTLKTSLHRILREGKNKIVVDCRQMDSLNSKALAIFLSAYKSLEGGTIAFAGANEHVTRIFHTTNLDTMFPLYDTIENAVDSVKS
ncbi:MAG: STAS domain-containing protein [Candidatus Omnitrophica bacterium]|nr:STAS domain-containing protein [Candidatus Omnitrophota bacterium]